MMLSLPVFVWLIASGGAAEPVDPAPAGPFDSGIEERVEVQLVLVDAVVLDRDGRTIPGLGIEDFEVRVDGRRVDLASLDAQCTEAALPDARPAGETEPEAPEGDVAVARRIVLVFDYAHMEIAVRAIEAARRAIERRRSGGEEIMVVSLLGGLRIEVPFTSDVDLVLRTLERMENDPSLYAGHTGHLTEWWFFERIAALFDLLEPLPGRKVLVLFSGPFEPDGFTHDEAYRKLAAMSARARTAVYPIDTGGLRTPFDPRGSPLGGPEDIRRLALETGGRMTADTNDLGLAYARAHRDLGCVYTLGFYDRAPRHDRARRLAVELRDGPRGARVSHAASYVVRSREEKRRSLVRTAWMAPEMFRGDAIEADLRVVKPVSERRWEARIDVEIRPERLAGGVGTKTSWEVRGSLRKPSGTIVRSFRRRLPAPAAGPAGPVVPVSLTETLRARPGRYILSVVLDDGVSEIPVSASREIEIPEIPREAVSSGDGPAAAAGPR